MFRYILILASPLLFGCTDTTTQKKQVNIPVATVSSKNFNLQGEWSICTRKTGWGDSVMTIQANVCTLVKFTNDNRAIVTLPSGDKQYVTYSMDLRKLTLTNNSLVNEGTYFENGVYEMNFEDKKGYTELQLILAAKHYTYILTL